MIIDITDPQEFDALMVRVNARRVAVIQQALGKPLPPGVARVLAGDTREQLRADNKAFREWARTRGIETMVRCNDSYSIGDGELLPYAEHPAIARQATERQG